MQSKIRDLFTRNALDSDVILEKALRLGSDYLPSGWQLLEKTEVTVTQITGGQSNLLFLASSDSKKLAAETPSCFLIRIHCQPASQVFSDTVIFSVLSERGLGPKLYGFFDGGRLEEYLPSRTLDVDNIIDPQIAARVGALFPKYHAIDVPIRKSPGAVRFIRQNLEDYKKLGGGTHIMRPNSVSYENEDKLKELTIEQFEKEIEIFEKWASVLDDTLVFSHNDLTPLNVLELNETKELVFIDFEYACYNWRGFDLSMHLCENAFDYRVPPPGVRIDQQFIENHPNLRTICAAYVETLHRMNGISGDQEADIEKLVMECEFFVPFVNLFWAVWSLKQNAAKHDNGHDLEVAASDRMTLYYHFKPRSEKIYEQFLNMST